MKDDYRNHCIGQDSIRWILSGEVAHKGHSIRLKEHTDFKAYIRAEIYDPGATITVTQTFGIFVARISSEKYSYFFHWSFEAKDTS